MQSMSYLYGILLINQCEAMSGLSVRVHGKNTRKKKTGVTKLWWKNTTPTSALVMLPNMAMGAMEPLVLGCPTLWWWCSPSFLWCLSNSNHVDAPKNVMCPGIGMTWKIQKLTHLCIIFPLYYLCIFIYFTLFSGFHLLEELPALPIAHMVILGSKTMR